jgi:hypothetical protein
LAYEFIENFSNRYDTLLEERVMNVSGMVGNCKMLWKKVDSGNAEKYIQTYNNHVQVP